MLLTWIVAIAATGITVVTHSDLEATPACFTIYLCSDSNLGNQCRLTYAALPTDEQLLNQPRQSRRAQNQPIAVAAGCCVWPWRLLRENNQQESS